MIRRRFPLLEGGESGILQTDRAHPVLNLEKRVKKTLTCGLYFMCLRKTSRFLAGRGCRMRRIRSCAGSLPSGGGPTGRILF